MALAAIARHPYPISLAPRTLPASGWSIIHRESELPVRWFLVPGVNAGGYLAIEVSERVMDMVRRELVENPDIDNAMLYEKARQIDAPAMEGVDRRQFNARYPLQVKRREMAPRPRKAMPSKPRRRARPEDGKVTAAAIPPGAPPSVFRTMARDGVRDVLLRFAQDLANADTRGDLVNVLASADQYVEQILALGFSE